MQCTQIAKNGRRCTHWTTNKNGDCGRHRPQASEPPLPPPPPIRPEPPLIPVGQEPSDRGRLSTRPLSPATGLGLTVAAAIAVVAWFLLWWLGLIFAALFLLLLYPLGVVPRRRTGSQRAADDQEADSA